MMNDEDTKAQGLRATCRPWVSPHAPPGAMRVDYTSPMDGAADWAIALPGRRRQWVVHLHGHGSTGDQPFTRKDIRENWLERYLDLGVGVLSPNLRGNAWMSPPAVRDLRALLSWTRGTFAVQAFYFLSGSMGGTSNLIYACLHPQDVAAVAALCPATDIAAYHAWLCGDTGGVKHQIRAAIESAYGGAPEGNPSPYAAHSALANARRLTMPLLLSHGTADPLIPVEQSRRLAETLAGRNNVTYVEIPNGNHDAPLHHAGMLDWLETLL